MSDQDPPRIEFGSTQLPDVLGQLAVVLPQFEGEDLESQLQIFDTFLDILSPSVRPQIADLFRGASAQTKKPEVRQRLLAAAENVSSGGRATKPYSPPPHPTLSSAPFEESGCLDKPLSDAPLPDETKGPAHTFAKTYQRRALVMEIGGFRPPSHLTSWFGKVTHGLPDEEWPLSPDDIPLVPLAQINLSELPFRPPYLQDIEFMTVFIDPEGYDENDSNGTTWCLRTYPHIHDLVPLETPEEIDSKIKAFPMRPSIVEADYPTYDDIEENLTEAMEDFYPEDFENVSGFKLGGWPTLIQSKIYWPTQAKNARVEYVSKLIVQKKGNGAGAMVASLILDGEVPQVMKENGFLPPNLFKRSVILYW